MDDKAMFDVLKPFMPMWCQKVLPAVFDQSLSYYELLCKVLQKYNELVVIVNAHSEKLEDHETRIVTLETITKEIQQKLAELDTRVKQNTANIAALTERVNQHDAEIETIQAFIDDLANSTNQHGFAITQDRSTIKFYAGTTSINAMSYSDALSTLIKRGSQVMRGYFEFGSQIICSFYTGSGSAANRIFGFGVALENNDLHYITFYADPSADNVNTGTVGNWKSVEILDITDVTQSEGTEEYKTISQKVITDLLKKKLASDMGISNATVGGYLNIASVDADGHPLTYGWGTPGGSGGDVDVVQTAGQSTTAVMSQKATTDAINSVKTNADAGATANDNLAATVVYPTTAGGTDGKFVDKNGATITRAALLASLIGGDGKNQVFAVKKTGSSEWQRITWFKASSGEGIYDFEWWEYDGTNAKCGVDRITMATTGLFAVSERSSKDLGGGVPTQGIDCTASVESDDLPNSNVDEREITIQIPVTASSLSEAISKVAEARQINVNLAFDGDEHPFMITPSVFIVGGQLCVCGSFGWPDLNSITSSSAAYVKNVSYWAHSESFADNILVLSGIMGYTGSTK